MKQNFDDLSPIDRQFILIASDAKYNQLVNEIPWHKFLWLLPALFFPYRFLLQFLPINIDQLRAALKRGEIPIPHLSPREAVDRFKFDYNHPNDGSVYIAHPVLPDHYLIPALANERLAQEKVSAFLDLTAALGAQKMEIVSAELLGQNKKGDLKISDEAAKIGIEYSSSSNADLSRKAYREFKQPNKAPFIPSHVIKWLEEDSMFRSLAYARLKSNIMSDKIQLRIENRYSIASSITLGFEDLGIAAGGKSKEVCSSVFGFSIEYWQKKINK
jgi:hypothetical protein